MAMRPEIRKTIDMARNGNQPGATFAALEIMGALLSQALDRLDKLDGGGGFLGDPDVLNNPDIL